MEEIKEFLEKNLDELVDELTSLKSKKEELDIKIKENSRFLEILKSENEEPFSEFTPRNVSYKNSEKINDLEEVTNSQKIEDNNIDSRINKINNRIDEIKKLISKLDSTSVISNSNSTLRVDFDKESVIDNINTIISYLPADPMRAKIELANLKKSLK